MNIHSLVIEGFESGSVLHQVWLSGQRCKEADDVRLGLLFPRPSSLSILYSDEIQQDHRVLASLLLLPGLWVVFHIKQHNRDAEVNLLGTFCAYPCRQTDNVRGSSGIVFLARASYDLVTVVNLWLTTNPNDGGAKICGASERGP